MRKIKLGSSGKYVMVDDEDFDRVSRHSWSIEKRPHGIYYAKAFINEKYVRLHRFVMKMRRGVGLIDHKNRNGLNNTKMNLVRSNHSKNTRNSKRFYKSSSGYRGVYLVRGMWRVILYLGYFKSKIAARTVYQKAVRKIFGIPSLHK